MDAITLHGVRAYGRHGVDPAERERRQLIEIDLSANVDLQAAATTDDLTNAVDYAALHAELVRIVATTSYALLERLGDELLDLLFTDVRIERATITLSKPNILDGATPSVTLERANPNRPAA